MNNPTRAELMEYIDGVLPSHRQNEINDLVKKSINLQKEIELLRAIGNSVQSNIQFSVSKNFTKNVIKELLPEQQETFLFRILKNSSNVFAMIMVLSLLLVIFIASPATSQSTSNPFYQSLESFSSIYNGALGYYDNWTKTISHPVNSSANSFSSKLFAIGIIIFSVYILIDGLISRKYFRS